jgi:UDP-glucuronate decarboxylase
MRMMDQNQESGPINIGNPVENSMLELAGKVIEITGSKSKLEHVDLPADDPKQRCPDITRARNLLGWFPQVDLQTGLQQTIQYYREVLAAENG